MLKAEKKLIAILKKSNAAGIKPEELLKLKVVQNLQLQCNHCFPWAKYKKIICKLFAFIFVLYLIFYLITDIDYQCLVKIPIDTSKVFRKSENCDMCRNRYNKEINHVTNISKTEFEEKYAHTGVPVIITDGAAKWPALDVFNFEFFKEIYSHDDDEHADVIDECQFFPYKTEFKSLQEVFNMSIDRSKLLPGTEPWYVGWSNCNDNAGKVLRQYYNQPYFLPDNSENIALSWIFMGGPGNGAHMHVDNVIHPSWQAQLSGKKLWRLVPPPECYYQCTELSAIVHPGQIIVVDTNKWYHQTTILDGDVSITIGSEFD